MDREFVDSVESGYLKVLRGLLIAHLEEEGYLTWTLARASDVPLRRARDEPLRLDTGSYCCDRIFYLRKTGEVIRTTTLRSLRCDVKAQQNKNAVRCVTASCNRFRQYKLRPPRCC